MTLILLEHHLAQAPKAFLSKLYRHWFPGEKGLVSNAQIGAALSDRTFDTARLEQLFLAMTPLQRQLLGAIYGAAGRGVTLEELQLNLPETERFLVADTVEEFRRELLIARSAESRRLFGFGDLWPDLADLFAADLGEVTENKCPRIDLEGFAPQHLLRLFALVRSEESPLTREGELGKRFRLLYEERLGFAKQLSDTASSEELDLLLALSLQEGWIVRSDDRLLLTDAGEEACSRTGRQLWLLLLDAWCSLRKFDAALLRPLLALLSTPRPPDSWSRIVSSNGTFRAAEDSDDRPAKWLRLPHTARELILLGMVAVVQNNKREAIALTLSSGAAHWCESGELPVIPEQPGFTTPDFEVLLPHTTAGREVWTLHRCCRLLSDDRLMKFRFEKEALLEAVQSGIAPSDVRRLADWIRLPDVPSRYVEEWLRSYEQCSFSHHLLLEVRDERLRKQIATTPIAEPWILEVLEGYGLLLREGAEKVLRPLLEEFGLHPPRWPAPKQTLPAAKKNRPPSRSEHALFSFDHEWIDPPESPTLRLGDLSPAAHHFRALTPEQRERVLTYSIRNGKMVYLMLRAPGEGKGKSVKFFPEEVERGVSPSLRGVEGNGERIEIPLIDIVNLRIPH